MTSIWKTRNSVSGSHRRALFLLLLVMIMMSCSVLVGTASASDSTAATEQGGNGDDTCVNEETCGNFENDDDDEDDEDEDDDDDEDIDDNVDENGLRRFVDDETGEVKKFDPTKQFQASIINLSKYRVDVYWDDNKYGVKMFDLDKGATTILNTFVGHRFFITRHGVRENLYPPEIEGEKDLPLKFRIQKPNQKLEIPQGSAPLSGVRAKKNRCVDRYGMCVTEAARGTCREAPGWMIVHCCKSCDEELNASALLDFDARCSKEHLNMTEPAWRPGDLNKLFEAWVTDDEYKQYTPNVVSSPGAAFGGIDGPWIITLDTFLTDYESDQIWEGGKRAGFDRSTDQGAANALGETEKIVSKTRTSNNAWCTDACERMPGVISATEKIERVTGVPRENYESFQVLQYHKNQFYRMHHDSSGKVDNPSGHRIMTFFLYLSDVEEGGATRFTKLGLDVKPQKGRALIWPSVLDDDPDMWDSRMYHEARDVIRGEKRAANHWIHLYDYETPNRWGCTGSFS